MLRAPRVFRVLAGLTSILAAAIGTAAQGQPATSAEGAAIVAAYAKLNTISYRVTMTTTSPQGGAVETEDWAPPGNYHITAAMAGSGQNTAIEAVVIGKVSAYRVGSGQWQCNINPSQMPIQPFSSTNMASGSGASPAHETVSRGPDTSIGGTPVHTYYDTAAMTDSNTGQSATTKATYYIGSQTGLLRRVTMSMTSAPGTLVTMDYTDYGRVRIQAPPCK